MERNSVGCQVCLIQFKSIFKLKQHFLSRAHKEKMENVFQKDILKGHGTFPFITPLAKHEKHPIIGLSLLTLCFSRETDTHYYLCHVCEEKRPSDKILHHLSSGDHCSNYFNYTNPNVLPFSWLPVMDMRAFLKPEITKEVNERGPGLLKMLDLPGDLFKKLETSTYNEAMKTLSENEKLPKLFEAFKPNRTMIQTYQRDSNRKHPLLGMQHLVECIGAGLTEKRHYLCTLCNLTIATHTIIKHVLSFDHIFCYFRAWHPSTLLTKECYQNYNKDFVSMILDLAKQTEEIHGTANTDMKQVNLEPGTSVNFSRYAEALKKLESITKENKTSLITTVKPGNKLERHTASAGSVAVHATLFYKVRCQNCNMVFTIGQYLNHLADLQNWKHKQMLKKSFAEAGRDDQTAFTPWLDLYTYTRGKEPAVGASLIVTCITTEIQMKPIYVCFACEDSFSDSFLKEHLDSQKHLILTLVYQNPWRLPFAWEKPLDMNFLRSMAWEEEKERGSHQMMLKVLDMPYWMFQRLIPPSYPKVMERLELYHTILKREVPRCETYSKLQQNERFPLLGHQFMVSYSVAVKWHPSTERESLCLLCERKLSKDEYYAHVFSREHVGTFLNHFHPGSLNSSMDAEALLDLAKQAARIHSVSHAQIMALETPIWEPCSYRKTISILASVKRREGKGKLEPEIIPKMKLSPRKTSKDMDKDHVRDNSQKNGRMMEGPEKNYSQKSIDNNETTMKKISVEAAAEIPSIHCVESAAGKKTHTQSEKESEQRREVFSKASSEETMNADSMCPAIKVEKIEEEKVEKTIKQEKVEEPTATLESCQNTDKNDGTEFGEKWRKSSKEVSTPLNNIYKENERKRPSNMFEKSQDTWDYKRQRLTSEHDASEGSGGKPSQTAKDKVSSNVNPQQGHHLWQYLQRESREPVVGLSALIECHCDQRAPIYLCECCSLKILEKDIVSHVTGLYHQKVYLGLQELSWNEQRQRIIRHQAALVEKEKGYGDAQVVDLDEDIYNNISKQNFKSAIQTVKALHTQQGGGRELPSTTALPAIHPVDTSVTLHAQHEVYSAMDEFRVVKMEIDDDSEDSEAQQSSVAAAVSVMAGTTSKTTEDVKMTNIKVLDSADNGNTCLTVSRCSKETTSLHVSISGANTARMHPESKGKAEHISVGSLKIATTSKIEGTCQTVATSDSTGTTLTRPMTAKTSNSIPDTTILSTISKLPATSSSYYTASTTLRETACKNVANTSSAGATPSKCTANASKLTGTTSTSSATNSSTTSTTMPATVSKPLESRTAAASMQVAVSSSKAATISNTGSKVVREVNSKTLPAYKNSETASKAMVTSAATAKMTNMSVKDENTEASVKTVHMKNSLGSSADVASKIPKSNASAALRQTTLMSVRSENQSPPPEPSHASASKTKSHETAPRVGINQLIVVSCRGKRQVYCQLCSVKMQKSDHLLDRVHKYNYVKKMYPWWKAKPSDMESKLDNMVANLAENDVGSPSAQTMEVNIDEYNELNGLPDNKALERVKAMVKQNKSQVSSSTTDAAEALRQRVAIASPCEISSPDDVTSMPQNEMAGPSTDNQSEQENKYEPQTPDKFERVKSDVESQATESAGRFAQTPDTCQETLLRGQQQERSDPDLQDTQKVLEGTQKTSLVTLFNPDALPSSATVNAEQQKQSGHSQRTQHVPIHHSTSQALSRMPVGEKTQGSHLSTYLKVRGLENEPVIGLGSMWECRGITRKAFFLCESCKVMLPAGLICAHVISIEHKLSYALRQDPKLMSLWRDDEHQEKILLDNLLNIVDKLSDREGLDKTEAQCVMLRNELYEYLQKASFSEALEIVKDIWKEQRLSVLCPPPSQQKDQQPDGQQSLEESLPTEMLSAQALETDHRSVNEARKKTEPHLEDTAMVGDLDEVKQGRVLSLDVTSVSLQADSVVSPLSAAATHISPKGTCVSLFVQPEVKPPVSQQQRPVPELLVKRAEVRSESPSSSVVSPSQSPSPSPSNKCLSTKKRPADETLVRPNINNQLKGPFAAKCSCSALQPISQPSPETASESTSVNHAATSTLLSAKDEGTGTGSDEQDTPIMDWDSFAQIMAMVRERKSEINMLPAPDNAETTTASANASTKSAVKRRWETKCVQTTSTVAKKEWDSESQLVKATSNADSAGTTVSNGVCQLPINTIVTARPDPTKQQFVGGFNGQDHNQISYGFSTAAAANASDTVAASGGYGQYRQMAYFANGHSDYLSEAVADYITPNKPPVYTGSLHQHEGYTTGGLYPSQIYPGQEANHFGHTATPTQGWVRLGMQQQPQQPQQPPQPPQQQPPQPPQQQQPPQQYLSWTSGSLAAGNGNVTSECAFFGAVQFPTPANNSQMLMGLNNYSTNTIVPTQNGNIIITQHNPQVYLNSDSRFSYNQQ
ncbi:uncharacterized protein LOC123976198 isoform X3 [Micropterus dolomieu]|uniref:uncharacterized protein LOC123976198 isoform X3 n=1 Tax=Micropterus dolomieu TaxID=147949 RepID=UPI001E8E088C|nr:uncharacterized protein LOC123976198 isoform X3 [Micropterus dolomieu]